MPCPWPGTGRRGLPTDLALIQRVVRENTTVPCVVVAGAATSGQAAELAAQGDGVIVDTAIAKQVAELGQSSVGSVGAYVRRMKKAVGQGL